MRSLIFSAACLCLYILLSGCGSGEATAPEADELAQYVNDNAEQIAAQEKIDDEEDVEEEDD